MKTETIEITRDVPPPEPIKKAGPGRKAVYPWAELAIGESFYIKRPLGQFAPQVYHAARRLKRKFAIRKEEKGVRVWRIG